LPFVVASFTRGTAGLAKSRDALLAIRTHPYITD